MSRTSSGNRTRFSPITTIFPCQLFHRCSIVIHLASVRWTMGPLQATIPHTDSLNHENKRFNDCSKQFILAKLSKCREQSIVYLTYEICRIIQRRLSPVFVNGAIWYSYSQFDSTGAGVRGDVVDWGIALHAWRLRVRFRLESLIFFILLMLPVA